MARGDRIIAALDVNHIEEVERLVDQLRPVIKIFKIGSELFTACGIEAVDMVRRKGCRVFLDLKYHDIPNIVMKASRAAAKQNIHMFTLHTLGGLSMLEKAASAAREEASRLGNEHPIVLGVTVLTSLNKNDIHAVGISGSLKNEVLRLVTLAEKAGLDGVVASAQEVPKIRKIVKPNFLIVTPGIRPAWAQKADQKRVATPKEALDMGSDYLVVGRPITSQEDPKAAAEKILQEINR